MNIGNLHPALSGFTPALLVSAVLFEAWGFFKGDQVSSVVARRLVYLSLAFAGLTFLSGYYAAPSAHQEYNVPLDPIASHYWLARILLFSYVPLTALSWVSAQTTSPSAFIRWLYRLALVTTCSVGLYTSTLGGTLVFSYGAGVSSSQSAPAEAPQ